MTSNDWQNRLLSDEELQQTLAKLGALEGMQVLQRQLELRAVQSVRPELLRSEVSNHLELGMTDLVPMVLDNDGIHAVEAINPVEAGKLVFDPEPAVLSLPPMPVEPVAAASPVPTDTDIVNNLNAIFAQKPTPVQGPTTPVARVEAVASPGPLEVVPSAPAVDQNPPAVVGGDYAPKPVVSETASVFIPTFANPLPANGEAAQGIVSFADANAPAVGDPKSPATPTFVEPVHAEIATAEVPVATELQSGLEVAAVADWQGSNLDADIPSAEEAVTAFEEAQTVNTPMPTLVDDLIIEVGGTDDEVAPESGAAAAVPIYATDDQSKADSGSTPLIKKPGSSIGHLMASWNGTGNLLFLIAVGFVVGMLKFSLLTVLAGAFGALALTGLGFGTAAVTARRGRHPQATISRAVFGVRGAAIPLVFIAIARYAATAAATIGAVIAVLWYFPSVSNTVQVAGFRVEGFYVALAGIVVLAALATIFGVVARRVISQIMAYASIAWVVAALALGYFINPSAYQLGSLNPAQALALASALLISVSVVWGTTAADETPDLRRGIQSVKIMAAGLLSHAIIGSAAVVAGYVYFGLNLAALKSASMGVVLAVAAVLTLAHQIRRTSDSFSGFGVAKTHWWIILGSVLIVSAGVVAMHLFIPADKLGTDVISMLPVVGVPVIAWLAAYGVDAMLRREDYHEVSLLRDYGFYGKVRVVNLMGWLVATLVGLGFVNCTVPGFGWLGYIAAPLGFAASGVNSDTGVWLAFVIAALTPLLTLRSIRNQELEGRALEERHRELVDVLGEI